MALDKLEEAEIPLTDLIYRNPENNKSVALFSFRRC